MNMENIFIHPFRNDSFSNLKESDLKELINEIENYYLVYRDTLNLPNYLTFGVEIEYEDVNPTLCDEFIKNDIHGTVSPVYGTLFSTNEWLSKRDASLDSGGEIVSPILKDEKKHWNDLKQICTFLKEQKANTCMNTASHVHVGMNIFNNKYASFRKFLKMYTIYENILFRFGYGDKVNARSKIRAFSGPIAELLNTIKWRLDTFKTIEELEDVLPKEKKIYALNFQHICFYNPNKLAGNTLEFRFPNGTDEEVIWQNNINVFSKMINASKNPNLDEDYLDKLLKKQEFLMLTQSKSEMWQRYNEICLTEALEFADLIFDNNLDKVYFLRQYFKNFENNKGLDTAVLARKFIK